MVKLKQHQSLFSMSTPSIIIFIFLFFDNYFIHLTIIFLKRLISLINL